MKPIRPVYRWLIHRADDLNHWTYPRRGRHWSLTFCLYDSDLLMYEDANGEWPSWRGSWRLARAGRRLADDWADWYPCCEHCGHAELAESPGHEFPCRVADCCKGSLGIMPGQGPGSPE